MSYLVGSDVLGADEQYIVIRVKNVEELVRKKGGTTGGIAFGLVPQTVTNQVYSEMAKKLSAGFRGEGVDADVSVVGNPPAGPNGKTDFWGGALLGAGAVGAGWLAWRLVRALLRR